MNIKIVAIGAAMLCVAGVFLVMRDAAPPAAADATPLLQIPETIPGTATSQSKPAGARSTETLINPLERSADLRATYEQFKNSRDPGERNVAYRAWSACFPTFVAPEGQAISLDNVVRSVPAGDPNSAQRIDAYRALMGRCKNFADMPRERIVAETELQKQDSNSGAALGPGEMAAKLLVDGDVERARAAARAVVASRDLAAVASLRGFVDKYEVLQVDAQPDASDRRPDLRSLAFTLAACRLGLECGPTSLTALQQCANTGACQGGVVERYMETVAAEDRARLQRETEQVAAAVSAGDYKALGW